MEVFKRYRVEAILIVAALILSVFSVAVFLSEKETEEAPIQVTRANEGPKELVFEVSGAVVKPGVYKAKQGARLADALSKAGGLSQEADKEFFSRNFNLSRYISDQEKIYIPSKQEVLRGLFKENQQTLLPQQTTNNQISQDSTSSKININSASLKELDSLPGVGEITAQKIIQQRPYSTVDELLTKKAVSQKVFDDIKALISLN